MNPGPKDEKSVRAGIFSSPTAADQAVAGLLAAGFSKEQITVVCSDEAREAHFREFEHQQPAGTNAEGGVAAGTSIGAVLGGLTAIAIGAGTGNVPLVIAGATGIGAGSAMGGFLGAMITRGGEKEASNYYEQAVRSGQILVTAEASGPRAESRLQQAAHIIAEAGADPVPLKEG